MSRRTLQVRLFNGADTSEAWNPDSPHFIDDCKPLEAVFHCDSVHDVYGWNIKLIGVDASEVAPGSDYGLDTLWLHREREYDLIQYGGNFYGDILIGPAPKEG